MKKCVAERLPLSPPPIWCRLAKVAAFHILLLPLLLFAAGPAAAAPLTKAFSLTIYLAGSPLANALNQPELVVTTAGSQPWFSESATTHDGVAAAQSGLIAHSQQSVMETTVTGPGTFSFWWKVPSEAAYDRTPPSSP